MVITHQHHRAAMHKAFICQMISIALVALGSSGCAVVQEKFWNTGVWAQGQTDSQAMVADSDAILAELMQADVIYLGETHDSIADHEAQLQIVQALHEQNPNLAIALEMFQHPYQPILDAYLRGDIDEAALREQTDYDQRWGFPWDYYAPMLRFAQAHELPLLALNAPSEVVRKVAQQGLDSLDEAEQQFIPPMSELRMDNEEYRQYVSAVFGQAHHGGHSDIEFENFFAAQIVWDETMADRITAFLQENPVHQVVVLAGQGHVIYGYGIPDRVARRMGDSLEQHKVLLNPSPDMVEAGEGAIADSFWFSDPSFDP